MSSKREGSFRWMLRMLAVLVLSGCGVFCPGDTPMTTTTATVGPYANSAECETARAAATAAQCGSITAPDAACIAYCKSGWYPGGCIAKATNASFVVAPACFPQQSDNQYYFSCTNSATCHCV